LIGTAAAGAPMCLRLNRLIEQGRFDQVNLLWLTGVLVALLGAFFLLCLMVMYCAGKGKLKINSVRCPECRKPLFGATAKVAIAPGMCVYSGERILNDAPPPRPRSDTHPRR